MHNEHLVYSPFPSEGNYQNLDGQSGEGLKRIFVSNSIFGVGYSIFGVNDANIGVDAFGETSPG